MATKLRTRTRRARFETDATFFERGHRPVMIELKPEYAVLWLKGCRKGKLSIPYDAIYWAAKHKIQSEAEATRAAARKKQRPKP